jgi:hypothetical protein
MAEWLKEKRLDRRNAAGEGKGGDRCLCFSSKTKKAEDGLRCYLKGTRFFDRRGMPGLSSFRPLAYNGMDSSLRALPSLSNNSGPGKRWQQQKGRGPCSCPPS